MDDREVDEGQEQPAVTYLCQVLVGHWVLWRDTEMSLA